MKPVIIIAIAVVCSVVAVFGVLGGLMLYGEYQYEKAVEDYNDETIRLQTEYENLCQEVFGYKLSEIGKPNYLQECLDGNLYRYDVAPVCGSMGLEGYSSCSKLFG
jgi:hypothetical protein